MLNDIKDESKNERSEIEIDEEKESVETNDKKSHKDRFARKIEKLEVENLKLKADMEHWKNEYYRAYADTKNLRDSLEKDHSKAMKYRIEGFIDELLPVLDSFYMALGNEPTDPALKNYLVGFQFIYKNLINVLENEGVKEIAPKLNDKFDPSVMNAVDTVEDDGEENIVKNVYAKGYMLHDRIVRPANVTVSKKKVEEVKETSTPEENKDKSDA